MEQLLINVEEAIIQAQGLLFLLYLAAAATFLLLTGMHWRQPNLTRRIAALVCLAIGVIFAVKLAIEFRVMVVAPQIFTDIEQAWDVWRLQVAVVLLFGGLPILFDMLLTERRSRTVAS